MFPLITNVTAQFVDDNGKPVAGGKVWTYESGTTNPKITYADPDGLAANTNPVILDEAGRANIYLADGAYRVRVLSANNVLIADVNKLSRYVTSTELDEFIQQVQDGLDELNQVKESLTTIVEQEIQSQKGVAGGLVPLNESDKIDPLYITKSDAIDLDKTDTLATSKAVKTINDKVNQKLEKKDLATGDAPIFAVRAMGAFSGTATKIGTGGNFKAVTRIDLGKFEVELETAMPDANYRVFLTASNNGGSAAQSASIDYTFTQTTTKFRIICTYGGDNTLGRFDPDRTDFLVI
ncbi:TPA: tail fiber protein [Acinetobacter baumannii]|nr:tail fiber protein [Acinetobacter baumannii]